MAKTKEKSLDPEQRFRNFVNEAPFSTALLRGKDFVIEIANEVTLKLWGKDNSVLGKKLVDALPEIEGQAVFQALKNVYKTGITYEGKENVAHLKIDGVIKKVYVNFVYKALRDEDNHISGILAMGYDVTEQVEARHKIAETEERARLAIEATGLGTFDYSYETNNVVTSPRFDAIFGFDHPQHNTLQYILAIHPEDKPIREKAHKKALETGELLYEVRLIWQDQSVHWVRLKGRVYYDNKNNPVRLLGTALDITEQKLALKSLADSEQRFRTLITETQVVATGLYIGPEIRIQYVNDVMLKFWGKDTSVIGKTFREAIPELVGQPFPELLEKVYETGEAYTGIGEKAELVIQGERSPYYFDYTYTPLRDPEGNVYGIHHMAVNVTEQVIAKQKLVENEKNFRNVVLEAPFGICLLKGKDFLIELANDAYLSLVEQKREDFENKLLWQRIPEQGNQSIDNLLKQVMRTGIACHAKEAEMQILRHGIMQTIYIDFAYEPLLEADGTINRIMVLAIDVTDKVLARKSVEKSRDDFNTILESLPQMAWTTNLNGEVTFITQQWYNYTGQKYGEGVGYGWITAVHPEDADNFMKQWKKAITTQSVFQQEARYRKGNGEYRWHLSRGIPIHDVNGNVSLWVGTNTDIHDSKLFREELEQKILERTRDLQQSNSELQQFAYVASHDLQEPVRKIKTFAEMLGNSLSEPTDKQKNYLDKIAASSTRMITLIKDVLNFSQLSKGHNKFEKVDLNEILRQSQNDFELLIEQKRARIISDRLPIIEAIPPQIGQLFNNLISNSLKFSVSEKAPVISIRTKHLTREEVLAHKGLNIHLPYIQIDWQDNGIGFSEEYAEQIFVIFQRLNDRHSYSGTGIGLALCRRIVTNHQGEISASSQPGHGATFFILLPTTQHPILNERTD